MCELAIDNHRGTAGRYTDHPHFPNGPARAGTLRGRRTTLGPFDRDYLLPVHTLILSRVQQECQARQG